MSTLTVTKPSQPAAETSAIATTTAPPLWARYVGAMLYFMGAALIAGGVVHYPVNPTQYTIICVVGAVVFALGTVFNEFVLAADRPTVRRAVWAVTISLFLSFGVGLAGGGIQHFDQFPERCAIMTPLGLAMSFLAYVAKDSEGNWRSIFGPFGAVVAGVVLAIWLGMSALAATIDTTGHDHGAASSSPSESTNGGQAPAPVEPGTAGDGHAAHGH